MKKTKNYKKQLKAKKIIKHTTSECEGTENVTLIDKAISAKSSSLIVSSLYLFSLAVIILALAVVVGLVSYVLSYKSEGKSTDRFNYVTGHVKVNNYIQDEDVAQENMDRIVDDGVLSHGSDSSHHSELQEQKTESEIEEQVSDAKPVIYLEHRDLFKTYTFDFQKALQRRQEAMKKYSYPYSTDGVDKRHNLSLQEFYDVYDGKWPVIITDVIPSWPAFNWSTQTLQQKYGEARVAMTTFNIKGLKTVKGSKEGYSVPLGMFMEHLNYSREDSWTYVQDEVFLAQFPELRAQVLDTDLQANPPYRSVLGNLLNLLHGTETDISCLSQQNLYQRGFFNLFPKPIRPWDCLLLWGTAHSRSTLHIDPYNWTGTNAVFSGLKKWKLLPPGQDKKLAIFPGAGCGFPLECHKYNSKYDTYTQSDEIKRKLKKIKYLEVDQMPGEILFLPTGWFHQAYNVVPTLAVSGELMNRNNYLAVLEEIFNVGTISRSILPHDVEKLSPEELVTYVMSKVPSEVLYHGTEWTKRTIDSLYNPKYVPLNDDNE